MKWSYRRVRSGISGILYVLKKCLGDLSLIIPTENVEIKDRLSYEKILVQILDRQVCKLITKEVAPVKVFWRHQFIEETTWEDEEDVKKRYPHIFESGENADQGTKFSSYNIMRLCVSILLLVG